jgi:tetratricopeptide (TPR) repeat protein
MSNNKTRSGYGLHIQQIKTFHTAAVIIAAALLITIPVPFILRLKNRGEGERSELLRLWEAGEIEQAFNTSGEALSSQPMDYFLLTIHGFAAYQMGISQINAHDTGVFIDECIRSLRKAMLLENAAKDGRVYYVLGKAYTYKGDAYADLAVQYLEKARSLSYDAADIPEYLGLAYAAVGDYRNSVAAFSLALEPVSGSAAPDTLLLSIARSYLALEELDAARAYLLRCIEVSPDSNTVLAARFLQAEISLKTGDSKEAENQLMTILDETGGNAEAHYRLGELYTLRGDTTRARSEWRLALRVDPAHAKTRERLNM